MKELNNYKKSRETLVKYLADKWEVDFDTSDDFNYDFSDIWINLINIEYCVEQELTFSQYLKWYDYTVENYGKDEPTVNLEHFTKYYKGFAK